jgi:trk system potassium uptake protein TrkH
MKVSTFLVLILRGWSNVRGYPKVSLARRTIPQEVIERATTTVLLFGGIAIVAITTLLVLEQSDSPHAELNVVFLDTMFEVVSALGTVGLSLGVTGDFTIAGRWMLIVLMFIGRLGPISVALALSRRERKAPLEFPEAEPLIG